MVTVILGRAKARSEEPELLAVAAPPWDARVKPEGDAGCGGVERAPSLILRCELSEPRRADEPPPHRPASRAVRGGKQQPGHEGEMVDEEAELVLPRLALPERGAVEGEAEEDHIGRSDERDFRKMGAGQEADDEQHLEECRDPGEEERKGKPRARDIAGGGVDVGELERGRHDERAGKDEPADKDGNRRPERSRSGRHHGAKIRVRGCHSFSRGGQHHSSASVPTPATSKIDKRLEMLTLFVPPPIFGFL